MNRLIKTQDASDIYRYGEYIIATNAPVSIARNIAQNRNVDIENLDFEWWIFILNNAFLGYYTHDGDISKTYNTKNEALIELGKKLNEFQENYPESIIYFTNGTNDYIIKVKEYFDSIKKQQNSLALTTSKENDESWLIKNKKTLIIGFVILIVVGGVMYWLYFKNNTIKKKKISKMEEKDEDEDEDIEDFDIEEII